MQLALVLLQKNAEANGLILFFSWILRIPRYPVGLNPRMKIYVLGKEISSLQCFFSPETGIAFYPGKARLLSCKHHYYDHIPPLINPGQPGDIECTTQRINYTDPFTNQTMVIII